MNLQDALYELERMTDIHDMGKLTNYYDDAGEIIRQKAYPFGDGTEDISKYARLQLDIATYIAAKVGAEGELQHTGGGISRIYSDGFLPPSLLRRIVPEVGLV